MTQPDPNETRKPKSKIDKDLDEQLKQTIPASDPPASTQPGSGRRRDDQAAWDEAPEAGGKA